MIKELIFSMESPYRDHFRIWGYRFGSGKKSLAVVGAMRGDEVRQQLVCAELIARLKEMEANGQLAQGHEILVIPSVNPFSMNIEKRFWALDGTDINRMFPGYELGETTQRIAGGLFNTIKDYKYGIQMASSYMAGDYIPHVRITKTGFEDVDTANLFGLPYVLLRTPKPFDTTTLNYNWQIWSSKAFSLYGGKNDDINPNGIRRTVESILMFIQKSRLSKNQSRNTTLSYQTIMLEDSNLVKVMAPKAGILQKSKNPFEEVSEGEIIARIIDPYEGTLLANIESPCNGMIFYEADKPLTLLNSPIFEIISY